MMVWTTIYSLSRGRARHLFPYNSGTIVQRVESLDEFLGSSWNPGSCHCAVAYLVISGGSCLFLTRLPSHNCLAFHDGFYSRPVDRQYSWFSWDTWVLYAALMSLWISSPHVSELGGWILEAEPTAQDWAGLLCPYTGSRRFPLDGSACRWALSWAGHKRHHQDTS
jgi:hypothetical protein